MLRSTQQSSKLTQLVWIVGLILFGAYGVLAFNSGTKVSPLINTATHPAERLEALRAKADRLEPISTTESAEIKALTPIWSRIVAKLSNDKMAFGSDGIADVQVYYFKMSQANKLALSTHMMLGVITMTFGFIQFWPYFRQTYRKAHRYIGGVYMLVACVSMSMSGYHLVTTSIANTFNTLVFYVGLWIMLIGVLLSIALASYYVVRKQIAQHMGWQAIGFGFFLSAPIQRFDWMTFAYLFPDRSFIEMNSIVDVVLFVQIVLLSYVIFCMNRSSGKAIQTPISQPSISQPVSPLTRNIVMLSLIPVIGSLVYHYLVSPGFAGISFGDGVLFSSLIELDRVIHQSTLTSLAFVLSIAAVLIGCVRLRLQPQTSIMSKQSFIIVAASVAGAIQIYWGWLIGGPSHAHSSGGSFYLANGLVMVLFAVLSGIALMKQQPLLFVERSGFLLASAMAPILLYWNILLLHVIAIIPTIYVLNGHAYELAATGSLFLPILIAMIAAIYGAETKRFRIS